MADDFQLKAIITAVDRLSGPMKGMQKKLKGFQKEMAGLSVGATAAGAAILGALAMPVTAAMGFESKMADIRKVVDGLDDRNAFAAMSDDILTLSTQLPMAAEGIAEIVAAGGQAGIARSDLMQFASDAVKMGVAFDTTAEESGQMMAQWRTAFKLTQDDVVVLADKINYLGNTGPANAGKISEIVTRIGPLGEIAGVASGEIAALGATIAGMGVEPEIAATGIKNFMKALTSGGAATKAQRTVLAALKIDPKKLAADMQKDSKGTMLKVLDGISKIPKEKQAAAMNMLFGSESAGAIAPLLTNMDLLRINFERVADAQQYGGSMQKEYASRAATTENQLTLLRNSVNAISVTLGDTFLPVINEAAEDVMPLLDHVRDLVRENPEMVKSVAKFAAVLLVAGSAVGVLSRAFRILNSVINLSPAKLAIAVLASGAMLIINNWDDVAPVIKEVWQEVDSVAQAMGGWETVLGGVGMYMTGAFTVKTIGSLRTAFALASQLSGVLGKIAMLGATTVQIAVAIYMFEKLKEIADAAKEADHTDSFWDSLKNRWNSGGWYNNRQQREMFAGQTTRDNYQPTVPLLRPGAVVDRAQSPQTQRSELNVSFDNAPPGIRVATPAGSATPWLSYDVGYSRFSRDS